MKTQEKPTVIDVRTPAEFSQGNVKGSINIPLQSLPNRIEEIKQLSQPLVLCCASGNRSGMAIGILNQQGIACTNGGAWTSIKHQ